ncbi:MAG: hypothetical protein HUK28_02715 [Methanobrevibacter sp.]|nr:hypothetical protein [Methanobrevibacter sp.]
MVIIERRINIYLVLTSFIILFIITLVLSGTVAYFTEEIISDLDNPPKFNLKWIFIKGIREIFFTIYMIINTIVIMGFEVIINLFPDYDDLLLIVKFLILSVLTLLPMTAMINVFLHNEEFKYGLKLKQLFNLIFNLKTSYFIILVIIWIAIENMVYIKSFSEALLNGISLIPLVESILISVIVAFLFVLVQLMGIIFIIVSNENQYQDKLISELKSL